jgi:hypothetical protein
VPKGRIRGSVWFTANTEVILHRPVESAPTSCSSQSRLVADVEVEDEYQFERRWYGSNPEQLRVLSEWLIEQQVEEVVMESTAQYWKPVWGALERFWRAMCQSREGAGRMSGTLHVAQALSNRGRRRRKTDFRDAERLVKRLISKELVLSFVPDAEQRLWRTLTRTRYQRKGDKVRLQNMVMFTEGFLPAYEDLRAIRAYRDDPRVCGPARKCQQHQVIASRPRESCQAPPHEM